MFEKALIPLDGSDLSQRILDYGHRLLERPGTEVVLLRVTPSGTAPGSALEAEARGHLDRASARLRAIGVTVHARVLSGDPAAQILECATAEKCSWILMATHGRTGLSRWVRGSVAERVLRGAETPLLVANPSALVAVADLAIRRILVPLDGSDRSAQIIPFVAELARLYGAEVILQTVVEQPIDFPTIPMRESPASAEAALRSQASRLEGLRVHILVSSGIPAETIVDAAKAQKADLVATATHGFSGLARWAFGSVAEQVVRHCACPLLTVRTVDRRPGSERG
jgi:nucleotide-binding universal stress UspA family protein